MRVAVVVHPRSGREELTWDGRELRLRITQPPVDGAANAAVLRLVAAWAGVAPSHVRLVAGRRGSHKQVEIEGIDVLPS
ncbi:MAG: DUF167 domain-containing protein [Candidatus Dormibacteria bacterium]|jgi:uncharacterized protein YggU (UPF0235/DUF167 family)